MLPFNRFQVLVKAHAFVIGVYQATDSFPRSEMFGIVSQLRRAAVSVASNIVEGSRRAGNAEFAHAVNIAQGSIGEAEYYLLLSADLGFGNADVLRRLRTDAEEIGRMLYGLRRTLLKNAT
jgi:four helix bundle protein